MPQDDLIIANGSGAAVRAKMNGALAALGSTMKGPNAPPAPTAGMMWLDDDTPSTSVWTLKIYDGAEWISIGTFDISANSFAPAAALLRLAAGAAAEPAISFGDTDTGIYSAGAGNVDIVANGQRVLSLTNSGGANFATLENAAGNLVSALYMSLKDASATVSRASFIAAVNETFVPVASIRKNLSTDGSSNIVLSATPPGSRTVDRRVDRVTIPGSGAITVAGPVNVASGGQAVTGDLEASGNLLFNSGYGSAAIAYGLRAWCLFNGTGTVTILGSGNMSSITDNGAGDYTANFTSAMPNTNYGFFGTARGVAGAFNGAVVAPHHSFAPTVTGIRFLVGNLDSIPVDRDRISISIVR